jgi:hypothetical protein
MVNEMHPVPRAPAPWTMRAESYLLLLRLKELPEGLYDGLEEAWQDEGLGRFKGGLGAVMIVRYADTPIGRLCLVLCAGVVIAAVWQSLAFLGTVIGVYVVVISCPSLSVSQSIHDECCRIVKRYGTMHKRCNEMPLLSAGMQAILNLYFTKDKKVHVQVLSIFDVFFCRPQQWTFQPPSNTWL